ncbi:uncharacterized protein NFIA_063570 [Aspergillus fischeri NRRL 181]|uniref:Uncharacterized protein n=1 Tax=Neosartorya fischeri (strain ATCC 1020 / DSM 3700 / CBS 544.65 / FGSC A1164 / JCM 1740 / NRRL 181 / WB 181) TaxID=331117 RepID=A1D652_NEOFI|nr:uncharacterized protein NFIA_063570 [Aspergillus fischeri NRRL 181]EAW21196.1 hypothetical protein NFIA_063570 [Aspergillus fischeri NRRL 181]
MFIWGVEQHRYRNYRSESHPPPSIFNQWLKRVFWTDTAKDWAYGEDDGSIIGLPPERLPAAPTCLRTTSDALRTVMDADRFTAIHAPFMMGHTFASEFQISLYTILRLSAPILTEGYLAFLCLMTGYQNPLTARRDEPNMSKAANGLQTLRNVTITRDFEAACTLLLGQAISLISAKPWYEELIQDPQMDTVIFAPILIDTVECLVHREVPIVRLPIPNRIVVDRAAML